MCIQLRSRNLAFGVYADGGVLIGIRTKFPNRWPELRKGYLDQEWDWDTHEGSVKVQKL